MIIRMNARIVLMFFANANSVSAQERVGAAALTVVAGVSPAARRLRRPHACHYRSRRGQRPPLQYPLLTDYRSPITENHALTAGDAASAEPSVAEYLWELELAAELKSV